MMNKTALRDAKKLADLLKKEALEVGIPLSESTDLLKLAMGKIWNIALSTNLPGGMSVDDLILKVIEDLTIRKPSKGIDVYNHKYMRDVLIPNIILNMKKEGIPLENILNNQTLKNVVSAFKFDPQIIEKSYNGEKKPLKNLVRKDLNLETLLENKPRPSIFKEFRGNSEGEFIKFWNKSVVNSALNELKLSKDKILDQSKRVIDENKYVDQVSTTSIEDKLIRKDVVSELSKLNPNYVAMVNSVREEGGLNKSALRKALPDLDDKEFEKTFDKFKVDMPAMFAKFGIKVDEAIRILKAKRIAKKANSIVRRYLDVYML